MVRNKCQTLKGPLTNMTSSSSQCQSLSGGVTVTVGLAGAVTSTVYSLNSWQVKFCTTITRLLLETAFIRRRSRSIGRTITGVDQLYALHCSEKLKKTLTLLHCSGRPIYLPQETHKSSRGLSLGSSSPDSSSQRWVRLFFAGLFIASEYDT
jgi:hypothetical protein